MSQSATPAKHAIIFFNIIFVVKSRRFKSSKIQEQDSKFNGFEIEILIAANIAWRPTHRQIIRAG